MSSQGLFLIRFSKLKEWAACLGEVGHGLLSTLTSHLLKKNRLENCLHRDARAANWMSLLLDCLTIKKACGNSKRILAPLLSETGKAGRDWQSFVFKRHSVSVCRVLSKGIQLSMWIWSARSQWYPLPGTEVWSLGSHTPMHQCSWLRVKESAAWNSL